MTIRCCPRCKRPFPPHGPCPCLKRTPVAVAPAAPDPALLCEYQHGKSAEWICVYCSHIPTEYEMTADGPPARVCPKKVANKNDCEEAAARHAGKEKRAKAARDKRKEKQKQLENIKKMLAVPLEVRRREAEERAEQKAAAERERLGLPEESQSIFAVSGGYDTERLATIAGLRETDTGRVTPEGVREHQLREDGELPDGMEFDPWGGHAAEVAEGNNKPIIPGGGFPVKLNDVDPKTHPAFQCIKDYFIKFETLRYLVRCTKCGAVQGNEDVVSEDYFTCQNCGVEHGGQDVTYICLLCTEWCCGEREAAAHMMQRHGEEDLPEHDRRFGNVLRRWVKGGRKPPNITKALKKAKKSVTP